MPSLLNKIKINKAIAKRKSFVLALSLIGFKATKTTVLNFNKMPIQLNHKKLNFTLNMFNNNCIIMVKGTPYKLDNNAADIKKFITRFERIEELKRKQSQASIFNSSVFNP